MVFYAIYEWMVQWYVWLLHFSFSYFPLKFRTVTHKMRLQIMKGRYVIKPGTIFMQRSEWNIWLFGLGSDPTHPLGSWDHGILQLNQLTKYFIQISGHHTSMLQISQIEILQLWDSIRCLCEYLAVQFWNWSVDWDTVLGFQ